MGSFSKAWSLMKMPYKANACPQCGLPTLLPHYLGGKSRSRDRVLHSTCMNCGFVAVNNQRRSSSRYLTDEEKDHFKQIGEKNNQNFIDIMQEADGGGSMPHRKTEYSNIYDILQHPIRMILADTDHESLSDLIRAYARLKAERDARLPNSMRSSIPDAEQHESELAEEALSGFEERNADYLLNAFLNMKRRGGE